ncbi:Coiled-coil domain-containing protein 94 [Dichanthelium oligosanthes]|uniref:Splicing factor YJU2 n=1 Tax=Dichanthelium oligosanthes TaxID=888268 RepID=A0A1E5W0H0_9POAL|nr:Coiled-coil domain-containing protein 94 [Dichanthelium oligosanthes]
MGERKVINKYYPHDFDPSRIPRRRRPRNEQTRVRMMLPMTLRCAACGEYLGRGTKFNARKEDDAGERYLGAIQVFRFYIRCPRCSAEIVFKTDPRNSDYAVESGATRGLQEPCRGGDGEAAAREEGGDAMAALEGRARDGRREMDADAALEEARELNARRARVAPEQVLESLQNRCRRAADGWEKLEQEADDALVKSIRFRNSAGYLKRIEEEDDREERGRVSVELAVHLDKTDANHQDHKRRRRQAAHRPIVLGSQGSGEMGERKVLNKYYPPDFDPSKIPRRRQPKNQQINVRMMLPMSIQCATCGTYIYKGTKFNSRKEDVVGETYLGIQIFRFYFKCTRCSAEITFKTDPQNSDYTVESGASRNFEPWREQDEAADNEKRKRDAEEMGDAMKALENRAMDSKQDMDILAALEEMRSMKSRHAGVSVDQMLEILKRSAHEKEEKAIAELDEEDEELIKSITFRNSGFYVKRIEDDDDDDDDDLVPGQSSTPIKINGSSESVTKPTDVLSKTNGSEGANKEGSKSWMPKFIVKPKSTSADPKRQKTESTAVEVSGKAPVAEQKSEPAIQTNVLQSLCQNYDSDSE